MKKALKNNQFFKGTKALVMGLGLHGGGVATAKWLARHGAKVTVTDRQKKEALTNSLKALQGVQITYVLGAHRHRDFELNDMIIANPGVPRNNEYLETARELGKRMENDASLFFRFSTNPIIAVTGTRGKSTTTLWIATLLQKKYPSVRPSGNTPRNAFLKEFDRVYKKDIPVVAEMSSWQLEYLHGEIRAPHIAIITNLYPDHLNRYHGIRDYAHAKANIFAAQRPDDFLILNYDNVWTPYFLKKRSKALHFFISMKPLPQGLHGLFVRGDMLVFRFDGIEQKLFAIKKFLTHYGAHNLENLMNAVLAVKLFDPTVHVRERDVLTLPAPPMRQEIIWKKRNLTVVNDSCATSPDGTMAAIARFRKQGNVILITGGTDKMLEFKELAAVIRRTIPPAQRIFLEGSATRKLITQLHPHQVSGHQKLSRSGLDNGEFKTLAECVTHAFDIARALKGKTVILFSPGAASFEKFLHEFDRGAQFNRLVKKEVGKRSR